VGVPSESEPAEQSDTEAEGGGGMPVIVESAELRDMRLRRKAPEGRPFVATAASLDLSTDEAQYTVLDGKGEVDGLPLRLAGKLGSARAVASGTGIDVDLNIALANVELGVDGTIGVLTPLAGVDLKAVASTDEIAQILEHFAVELPLSGPVPAHGGSSILCSGTQVNIACALRRSKISVSECRQPEK
jgi:hypothetical protein